MFTASVGRADAAHGPHVYFSVIDGIQRLCCYLIAVLLVWQRERLIRDHVIGEETWEYFKGVVEATGEPEPALTTRPEFCCGILLREAKVQWNAVLQKTKTP